MGKSDKALRGLLEWIIAHLYKNQPSPEMVDCAQRVLSDQLPANLPHVVASIALGDPSLRPVAWAAQRAQGGGLSLAVVCEADHGLYLVHCVNGRVNRQELPRAYPASGGSRQVHVIFPSEWDDRPFVVYPTVGLNDENDGNYHYCWGEQTGRMPFDSIQEKGGPNVHVWMKDHTKGWRVVVVVAEPSDACVRVYERNSDGRYAQTVMLPANFSKMANGKLLVFQSDKGCVIEIGADGNGKHPLVFEGWPDRGSLWQSVGRLRCVVRRGDRRVVVWQDKDFKTCETLVPKGKVVAYHGGEIVVLGVETQTGWSAHRFADGEFVLVSDVLSDEDSVLYSNNTEVALFGETLAFWDFRSEFLFSSPSKIVLLDPHKGRSAPHSVDFTDALRAPCGVLINLRQDGGERKWRWMPIGKNRSDFKDFPRYDVPFDHFVVIDADTVMAWNIKDGTLHVLEYKLPR